MSIQTAVIPVAGAGSRVFPITTAIEKCLLPVYAGEHTKLLIDYMVQECATAGVKRVIFVTTPRGQLQLHDYFGRKLPVHVREQLETTNKHSLIEKEMKRREGYGILFEYILQPANVYGTTVPLYLAQDALQGEKHFALMGGDDFVYHPDGSSELAEAIKGWKADGADHAIMGLPISRPEAPKYGILQTANNRLTAIDEKPPLEQVPERPVANISRYLLHENIWDVINEEIAKDRGQGEHYITYPIAEALTRSQSFYVHPVTGHYMDGGNFEGLSRAGSYITEHPPVAT